MSTDKQCALVANHTSTSNPTPPATYPVLYADDYGKTRTHSNLNINR
jgi:hypothetical protein